MRSDFAIFIMVYGRPDKAWTYNSLRNQGYTGKIFLVADDTDEKRFEYKKLYKENLIIFNKQEAAKKMDTGDNTGDLRSTLFSANTIQEIAKEKGLKYFFIMCDDYTAFYHNFKERDKKYSFEKTRVKNLDKIFNVMVNFYEQTPITTLCMSQGGDFLGGANGSNAEIKILRKAINSFLCSTERPFEFVGRLNEDCTTYVRLGSIGVLFMTITNVMLVQTAHQQEKSGLTDVYLDYGTYVKSFFSVMYNPSSVKIKTMGSKNFRIHHRVKWNNAVPKILRENHRKNGTK